MSAIEIVELLGAIAEVIAAIAVVVTLIYLAAQVRHSAAASQAAALEAGRSRRIAFFESVRDSAYLPAIQVKAARGEELDEVDRLRLANHYAALWGLLYAEWIQRDLGMVGEYATQPRIALAQTLGSNAGMQWWRNVGTQLYPARFVRYVEAMIRELDVEATAEAVARAGFVFERRADSVGDSRNSARTSS